MRNGQKIKIWTDKWVPNPSSYRVWSPLKILDRESKVKELIERTKEEGMKIS